MLKPLLQGGFIVLAVTVAGLLGTGNTAAQDGSAPGSSTLGSSAPGSSTLGSSAPGSSTLGSFAPGSSTVDIRKVEPPNWWVGMKWSTVQFMVYGDELAGVTATFNDPRLKITGVHTLESSSYAFVDVHIPPDLAAGSYTLTLTTAAGSASVAIPILERESAEGRFQGFSSQDVVYLITPDRFADGDPSNNRGDGTVRDEFDRSLPGGRHGGDLKGITEHLDYLADLGVTAIWPNPLLENNGRSSYHGYAATDLYRIDPRFGSNADLRTLVDEGHRRGIKFISDHVNNHIGIGHPWMNDLPAASWLNGSVEDHLGAAHFKYSITDPYTPPSIEERLRTFWFVRAMPDLNQRDPFLATYLIQNTLWWIEYTGMDGIREDTYVYPDQAFLARWAAAILEEYPDFNIVGEIWEGTSSYLAMFQKESRLPRDFETNLPAVMDFALTDAFREYVSGEASLQAVYRVISQDFLYTDPANLMTFLDNHDMSRAIFHAGGDTRRVLQALGILLTTRGIPQILYGTEINMMGGESHVELRADFPGGFPGDARNAFRETGRTAQENEVFSHVRRLLLIRKTHPALTRGRLIHYPPDYGFNVYRYLRTYGDETILVVSNGNEEETSISLRDMEPELPYGVRLRDLLTGQDVRPGADGSIRVDGLSTKVYLVQHGDTSWN